MKTKLLILLLAGSLAGNVAFVVTTAAAGREVAMLPMERLGLEADQRAKLMEVREHFVAERARAHERMRELRGRLADEIAKASPDRAQMAKLTDEMAAVQSEMRPEFIAHLLDMHALLRPEQRVALGNMLRASDMPEASCVGAALGPAGGAGNR
jgi:Spy/CpxP family protein refolding chaperone